MSQALLSAAALAAHTSMARILLREYGIGHHARPGIAGSCGGNWKQNVDKAIVRQIDMFPQSRSEEHTSELQSLMRISYAVFCLKKKKTLKAKHNKQKK